MKAFDITLALVRAMADRGEVIDPFEYVGTTVTGLEVHSSLINVLSYMPLEKIERILDSKRILLWQDGDATSVKVDGPARTAVNEVLDYWIGPWPTNYLEWYVKDPRTADEICRFRMWHPSLWGCAL